MSDRYLLFMGNNYSLSSSINNFFGSADTFDEVEELRKSIDPDVHARVLDTHNLTVVSFVPFWTDSWSEPVPLEN